MAEPCPSLSAPCWAPRPSPEGLSHTLCSFLACPLGTSRTPPAPQASPSRYHGNPRPRKKQPTEAQIRNSKNEPLRPAPPLSATLCQ